MRSIIISGASSGIGAALARQLAGAGVRLGLLGRNADRLRAVAADSEKHGAICRIGCFDLRDRAALAAYCSSFEEEAPIDVVISNAGILAGRNRDQGIEDAETANMVLSTNLCSAVDLAALCISGMRTRRSGKIVLISSLAAFSPLADAPAYSAAKAGLVAYGLALRQALAQDGIDVVVSCPGYVETPMGAIHIGSRPMETTADEAARRIIDALDRNRAISGFPFPLYWSARLSQLAPEWIRRIATGGLRFHVRQHD